jgi:hypothetical protein
MRILQLMYYDTDGFSLHRQDCTRSLGCLHSKNAHLNFTCLRMEHGQCNRWIWLDC